MTALDDMLSEIRDGFLLSLLYALFALAVSSVIIEQYTTRIVPGQTLALAITMLSVCIVVWLVMRWKPAIAPYVFLSLLFCLGGIVFLNYEQDTFLYFLIALTWASVWLLPRFQASLVVIVLVGLVLGQQKATPIEPLLILLVVYFVAYRLRTLILAQFVIVSSYYPEAARKLEEARLARAELARLTIELEEAYERIKHANFQLQHAYQTAEEARQLKAQFAANVSHELRTPINLIVGFAEVMVTSPESYGVHLPAAYRPDILSIYRNARHLQSLINDILDISQIEAESMSLTKEETDLAGTLHEAADIARDLIERKGLSFIVECPSTLPQVWIDRTRIRQVILNLLANAARFTDHGQITLTARQVADELEVSVIDTGIGLQEKDKERIFEEFYQTDGSLSRKAGGTGLGLALSQRFVREHGGRIRVKSDGLGYGSTFAFTLPLRSTMSFRLGRTRGLWVRNNTSVPDSSVRRPVDSRDASLLTLDGRLCARSSPPLCFCHLRVGLGCFALSPDAVAHD